MDLQEEKGPASVIYTSIVRMYGAKSRYEHCHHCSCEFILMFFSPATRLLWNAGVLIRSQLLLYYNQICKVVDFSVLTGTTDVMIVITSVCQKKRGGKKIYPWE